MSGKVLVPVCGALAAVAGLCHAADPISVCIGAAGTMRVLESGVCEAEEELKRFAEWEQEIEEIEEADDPAAEDETDALEARVQELTSRLAALERNAAAAETAKSGGTSQSRVTAPFEVVGAGGTVILRVADAVSSANGEGAHVTIGAGDAGNFGVRVYKGGGTFVAGIGQALTGAGLAVVMDESGDIAANLNGTAKSVSVYRNGIVVAGLVAEERGGTVAVYNSGKPIAYLTQSSGGDGGNVTTALNSGFGVFSAGAAQDGGGEACINRVTGGGQRRNACLGLELPSMGLGK